MNCKAVLRKKDNAEGIIPPDFRQYYKATVIKTVQYGHKNRYIYISRLEWRAPKINHHIYSQLVFDKRGKNIQWKKNLFSKWGWKSWTTACKNQ